MALFKHDSWWPLLDAKSWTNWNELEMEKWFYFLFDFTQINDKNVISQLHDSDGGYHAFELCWFKKLTEMSYVHNWNDLCIEDASRLKAFRVLIEVFARNHFYPFICAHWLPVMVFNVLCYNRVTTGLKENIAEKV